MNPNLDELIRRLKHGKAIEEACRRCRSGDCAWCPYYEHPDKWLLLDFEIALIVRKAKKGEYRHPLLKDPDDINIEVFSEETKMFLSMSDEEIERIVRAVYS